MKVSFTVLLVSDKSQDASPSPANGSQQLLNKSSCVVSVSCSYSLSRFPFLSLLSLFITASFHHFSLLTFSSFLVPQFRVAHFLRHSPSNLILIFAFSLHLHLLSLRHPPALCFCLSSHSLSLFSSASHRCGRRRYSWSSLPSVPSVFCCTMGVTWPGEWPTIWKHIKYPLFFYKSIWSLLQWKILTVVVPHFCLIGINREGLIIKVKHRNLERLSTAMLVEGPIIKVECCRLLTAQHFALFQLPILNVFIVSLHWTLLFPHPTSYHWLCSEHCILYITLFSDIYQTPQILGEFRTGILQCLQQMH